MRTRTHILIQALIVVMTLGCILWPLPLNAATVMVQTTADPAGQSGGSGQGGLIALYILVTDPLNGSGIATLGSTGSLPSTWSVQVLTSTPFTFTPVSFANTGNGTYKLTASPPILCSNDNGQVFACWSRGEYHYVIRLNVTVSGTTYQGSGLGVLVIP